MDWRNEESDYSSVENFISDEKNPLTKTKSDISLSGILGCNVCSQGVQAGIGGCKESRSFAAAFERLELEAEIEARNDAVPFLRNSDAQTDSFDGTEQDIITDLRIKESLLGRPFIHGTDILNFQGRRYSPKDIAHYWKKDSRMWLWKSVRLLRKKRSKAVDHSKNHESSEN